ncbi:hypothetical protein BDV29DRAFT_28936 [Aspergillus leporis]|jgi:hypothetical protein|uniref:Uncharacterized protein n=1 Tax=Aspergillus leporis TaxID=41062 RepID=A0A5N5WSX1_9EURO|nr:hypothetical protein BDV29DRAFT_28936 [Aspergillus leporis]
MGKTKVANIKVKVDLHKYSDQLHIYRLRSECNRRATRYIFHNVSTEDTVLGMETFNTIILATTRRFSKALLFPGVATTYMSQDMRAKVETWPVSQTLAKGLLHNEGTAIRSQQNFKSKDFDFVEMIEREHTSMDELVEAFTQKLYLMPSIFKGTIYKMEWDQAHFLFDQLACDYGIYAVFPQSDGLGRQLALWRTPRSRPAPLTCCHVACAAHQSSSGFAR